MPAQFRKNDNRTVGAVSAAYLTMIARKGSFRAYSTQGFLKRGHRKSTDDILLSGVQGSMLKKSTSPVSLKVSSPPMIKIPIGAINTNMMDVRSGTSFEELSKVNLLLSNLNTVEQEINSPETCSRIFSKIADDQVGTKSTLINENLTKERFTEG